MKYTINSQPEITNKDAFESLLPYFKGEYKNLFLVVLTTIISASADIISPFLITIIIDQYILKQNSQGLGLFALILLGFFISSTIASYTQGLIMGKLAQRILLKIRNNLFSKLQDFNLTFFNQNKTGDIIARINNDTEKISNFLGQTVFQIFDSFLKFIGIGIFIFFLNIPLSFTIWIAIGVSIILMIPLNRWVRKSNKDALEANGEMSAVIDENFNNYKAVVAFNQQPYLREVFKKSNEDNYKKSITSQILNGVFQPLYAFAGNISQIAVVIVGVTLVTQGNLTLGLLVGFVTFAQKLSAPLADLGSSWGSIQSALAAWRRIQQLLRLNTKI